ncbi:MAG: SLC13 family permease [Chloroflexota bacterium]
MLQSDPGQDATQGAAEALASTPFFAGLRPVDLARLVPELEEVEVPAGRRVCAMGEQADGLYLIRRGVAAVTVGGEGAADGPAQVVATLAAPAYFGEMALLSEEPRSATVTAVSALSLWRLPRERFEALTHNDPRLLLRLTAEVTRRLAETTRRLSESQQAVSSIVVAEYAHLDTSQQRLLQLAAVAPSFDRDLLAALADDPGLARQQEWLEREGLLVVQCPQPGYWRVADQTLRDYLHARLAEAEGADRLRDLRRRAALHLLARGEDRAAEALELQVAAGDDEAVRMLLSERGEELCQTHPRLVERALRGLDQGGPWADVTLCSLLAEACASQDRPADALDVLHEMERRGRVALRGSVGAAHQRTLADYYERLGRHEQAAACLRAAVSLTSHTDASPGAGDLRTAGVGAVANGVDARLGLSALRGLSHASATFAFRAATLPTRWVLAAVVLGVTAVAWSIEPPMGLTPAGWRVLTGIIASICLSCLHVLPEYLVGLTAILVWVSTGTLPLSVAAAGFSSSTWFLLMASMALGGSVARCGLLYRGALYIVRLLPPSHAVRCLTLALLGTLFSTGMPNGSGRVALAAPLALDISDSLRYPPRSGGSAGLVLATFLGFGLMGTLFLTGNALCLIVYGLLPPDVQAEMSWVRWFLAALPTHALLLALGMTFLLWRYRPDAPDQLRAEAVAIQQAVLGRLTRVEWINLAVLLALIAGFATQAIHRVDPAWLAVAAVIVLFIGGALNDGSFRDGVNWGFMLYLGGILSFGAIFSHVKLDQWLGDSLTPLIALTEGSPGAFVMLMAFLSAAIAAMLRSGLIPILIGLALFPTAAAMGVSPWVVSFASLMSVGLWLYPEQSVVYLTAYFGADERGFSHRQARPLAIAWAAFVFLSILASIPYWRWLGLIR